MQNSTVTLLEVFVEAMTMMMEEGATAAIKRIMQNEVFYELFTIFVVLLDF